jgi:glycosyltransferase involved in cell wall biosynthesis
MKVIHVTSEVGGGGAARAALNLHFGLLRHGVDSVMIVGEIYGDIPQGVVQIASMRDAEKEFTSESDLLVWSNRSNRSNTHFSLNLPGWDPLTCDLLQEADLINLHWVAGCLSASSISALASLGKPIVWTLHDMRPLTGGCHFPAGCEGFEYDCRECPQLNDDLDGLASKNKELLARAIEKAGIHIVTPSSWMLERAKKATSLGGRQVSFNPNGVDSEHFAPGDKLQARQQLGLDPEASYILLASHNNRERRKGFEEALQILQEFKKRAVIAPKVADASIRILLCGHETGVIQFPGYTVDRVGYVDYETMPVLYQAADVLLFTSLEDNMPNIVMEGLACGLPVVGHDLGGVRDLIGRESGAECLFQIGDADQAVTLLHTLLLEKKKRAEMGRSAALRMKTHFSLNKQTEAYLELYRSLLGNPLCDGKSKGVSREEEYRNLVGALSKKIETLEKHHLSLTHQLESHQILGGSKWVRLGQVLKLCHRP